MNMQPLNPGLLFTSTYLLCLLSYLLIDYLRHIIVRVMKDTHREMTEIKGEDMNVQVSISCCPCSV